MAVIQLREALRAAMTEEMERDPNVLLLGEEVAQYNGAYKVSQGMLDKFGPDRVIDTPISEAAFSGLAVGSATLGLRPIVEFMSWSFTWVCIDQIVNNAANVRYMSGGQYKVPVVFRGGNGIAHQLGATHSHRMESVYSRIPGLITVAPSTPAEAKGLLKSAIRCDDPVIFLESEKMLADTGEVPDDVNFTIPLGIANVERRGSDVTVISYGRPLQRVVRPAVEALVKDHNIDVELIDLRTLRPIDVNTIVESVKKTNRCVIVDEDWGYCGMGSGIMLKLQKPCFDYLDAPIEYVHSDEIPVPFNHYLEEAMLPSVDRIVSAVKEVCYR
ncbi:MAG: Pyruvate dehydrogenase E1 component beta subunit [uncultured Phycisphaerae bacterium]|uniref:Pyruvate dehydrogenase E1 component beta subunit n=1 Tax=uncultured Phycisphaerae bacterium TaxID=904963 RepID=A0A6J4N1R9_9BACT|nr:MAG: Pyruvate dehydrogenase E1 component beta subunit [uncultured Phycisphaerae bacterium]